MEYSRNALQEKAMTIIYAALTYVSMHSDFDIKELTTSNFEDLAYDDIDLYVREVTVKALLYRDVIIADVEKNMVQWTFKRLNRVAQAILLLSVAHYRYVKDVDKSVVIDIAVKLAKKFLDDDDYKFINGVLDKTLV